MGSLAKLQRMLNGAKLDDVVNAAKNPLYRFERLGSKHNDPMRSEEIALEYGDLTTFSGSPGQVFARNHVVSKGIENGNEWGAAVHSASETIFFGGEYRNRIDVPTFDAVPPKSISIHHNHPFGDSFSRADLRLLLSRSEIGEIQAHGHLGFDAFASRVVSSMPSDAALRVVQDAFVIGESGVKSALAKAEISFEQAQSGLKMVVAAMHLEKTGLIRYTANSPALLALAKKVLEYAKQ